MFRRFWKTIKIFGILIIILICLPHSILPRQFSSSTEVQDIDNYIKLNDEEKRLAEYKDDNETLKLKLIQLDIINTSRRKFKAQPVKLDILASRVANKMSREAAENDFTGHWNLAGEKPYHRYGFAGGYDHIIENAYGEWTTGSYEISPETISAMMKNGHSTFMKEKAPYDGHKKAIIDKYHNYVGIGCYINRNQFRYYEEFIDRYLSFENIPSQVKQGETFNINFKPAGREYPYFMTIYRDKSLKPMSPQEIKRRGSYPDYSDEEYKTLTAWELSSYKKDGAYSVPLNFTKEGIYYIQIFLDSREITKPTSLNTKGKTPASGIVIKVYNQ
jgi:uncharacterized protein YkwD